MTTLDEEGPHPDGAAFLVRAWYEGDKFRARITYTLDVYRPAGTLTEVVGSPDAVYGLLTHWLAGVPDAPTNT